MLTSNRQLLGVLALVALAGATACGAYGEPPPMALFRPAVLGATCELKTPVPGPNTPDACAASCAADDHCSAFAFYRREGGGRPCWLCPSAKSRPSKLGRDVALYTRTAVGHTDNALEQRQPPPPPPPPKRPSDGGCASGQIDGAALGALFGELLDAFEPAPQPAEEPALPAQREHADLALSPDWKNGLTRASRLRVTRAVTVGECPWLERAIPRGAVVFRWSGQTYGVVSRSGVAVALEEGGEAFVELPADALEPVAESAEDLADEHIADAHIDEAIADETIGVQHAPIGVLHEGMCSAGDRVMAVFFNEKRNSYPATLHAIHELRGELVAEVDWSDGDTRHRLVGLDDVRKGGVPCSAALDGPEEVVELPERVVEEVARLCDGTSDTDCKAARPAGTEPAPPQCTAKLAAVGKTCAVLQERFGGEDSASASCVAAARACGEQPGGSFAVAGTLDTARGLWDFRPQNWLREPAGGGWVMVGARGRLGPLGERLEGAITEDGDGHGRGAPVLQGCTALSMRAAEHQPQGGALPFPTVWEGEYSCFGTRTAATLRVVDGRRSAAGGAWELRGEFSFRVAPDVFPTAIGNARVTPKGSPAARWHAAGMELLARQHQRRHGHRMRRVLHELLGRHKAPRSERLDELAPMSTRELQQRHAAQAVGRRIAVQWKEGWFEGTVAAYDAASGKHRVEYDDGDVREYDLERKSNFKWIPAESAPSPPLGAPATPQAIVGRRIAVQWKEGWFEGTVAAYDAGSGLHTVLYDDGDVREYDLSRKSNFKLIAAAEAPKAERAAERSRSPPPTAPSAAAGCTLSGGESVEDGWSGSDTGGNSCNTCHCADGSLGCTRMGCGGPRPAADPAAEAHGGGGGSGSFWVQATEGEDGELIVEPRGWIRPVDGYMMVGLRARRLPSTPPRLVGVLTHPDAPSEALPGCGALELRPADGAEGADTWEGNYTCHGTRHLLTLRFVGAGSRQRKGVFEFDVAGAAVDGEAEGEQVPQQCGVAGAAPEGEEELLQQCEEWTEEEVARWEREALREAIAQSRGERQAVGVRPEWDEMNDRQQQQHQQQHHHHRQQQQQHQHQHQQYQAGDRVVALSGSKKGLEGSVVSFDESNGKFSVLWDSLGTASNYKPHNLGAAPSSGGSVVAAATSKQNGSGGSAAQWACVVGDEVTAVWAGNNRWFNGRIAQLNQPAGIAEIDWADGDSSHRVVALSHVLKDNRRCAVGPAA